jgi:hypothetical protein
MLLVLMFGCHDGTEGGIGTPCEYLSKPCRTGFVCIAGRCQPHDSIGAHPPCKHTQPFTTVAVIPVIGAAENALPGKPLFDAAARLSPDELQIYFTSAREGESQIYEGFRETRFETFGVWFTAWPPSTMLDLNPSVSGDMLTMFVESSSGAGGSTIRMTRRDTSTARWLTPIEFAPLAHAPPITDGMPYVLPKGDVLYFQSNREGSSHIFRTARDENGTWSAPERAITFDEEPELSPVVTEDETTIYYATENDVWVAWREPGDHSPPAVRTPVEGINTDMDETPSWISPDACRLYFSRRMANTGNSQIYLAERTPD